MQQSGKVVVEFLLRVSLLSFSNLNVIGIVLSTLGLIDYYDIVDVIIKVIVINHSSK